MLRKARFIIVLISLSVCLCLMSTTYSRYVADATSNIEVLFSKWQILVNDTDITNDTSSTITFTPIIEENDHVKANVIAPSSKGYFDIEINPTNIDVSFQYEINLDIENEEIPDLMANKYAIIPIDYVDGETLEIIDIEDNLIFNTLYFDKETELFQFEPFTIRIFFEWYEGENEMMDDNADTTIGHLAATEDITFTINADISFEQIFE